MTGYKNNMEKDVTPVIQRKQILEPINYTGISIQGLEIYTKDLLFFFKGKKKPHNELFYHSFKLSLVHEM